MADRAEVKNAADPEQVTRAARRGRRKEQMRSAIVRSVLATPDGRALLWYLLGDVGLYTSSYFPGVDALELAFREGERNVGRRLRAELEAVDDVAVELMEREARARARRDAQDIDAGHQPPANEESDAERDRRQSGR